MNLKKLVNWYFSYELTDNLSEYSVDVIAELIAGCAAKNDFRHYDKPNSSETLIVSRNIEELIKGHDYGFELRSIHDYLCAEHCTGLKSVILHGSMVSRDYIKGWSDLDSWVLLDVQELNHNNVVKLWYTFRDLNAYLRLIDPQSHHAFIFYLDNELQCYNEVKSLPLNVLREGVCVNGDNVIRFDLSTLNEGGVTGLDRLETVFSRFNETSVLKTHQYHGIFLEKNRESHKRSPYHVKYVVAMILNIPVLYFTAKGLSVYKKKSFDLFYSEFSVGMELIRRCENIRLLWSENTGEVVSDLILEMLGEDYIDEALTILNRLKENI